MSGEGMPRFTADEYVSPFAVERARGIRDPRRGPLRPWEVLVERYVPDGKRVCNCSQAYETLMDKGPNAGHWVCEYGCSATIGFTRDYIASRVLEDQSKGAL